MDYINKIKTAIAATNLITGEATILDREVWLDESEFTYVDLSQEYILTGDTVPRYPVYTILSHYHTYDGIKYYSYSTIRRVLRTFVSINHLKANPPYGTYLETTIEVDKVGNVFNVFQSNHYMRLTDKDIRYLYSKL